MKNKLKETQNIHKKRSSRQNFSTRYAQEDILLLGITDEAHLQLSRGEG